VGGIRVCDVDPWACGDGGAERKETGEEVGDGFGELPCADGAFVGVVEGFVGRRHGCFGDVGGGDGGEPEMVDGPVCCRIEGGRQIFEVGAERVIAYGDGCYGQRLEGVSGCSDQP